MTGEVAKAIGRYNCHSCATTRKCSCGQRKSRKRFNEMVQQISRISLNGSVGNDQVGRNFQEAQTFARNVDMNEGLGEVHNR